MDMNTMAQRFATTYGGAMPIAPEMPSFGAMPPQAPSQTIVPQMERPAPAPVQPAPSVPSVPDGYDPDEWEQEKKDYAAAIKGGYINKRGVSKDGKMWRGPKSLEYYATHGQDAIFKNANDLSEWNRITFEENRRLAGLPDIQPQQPQQPAQVLSPYGEVPEDRKKNGIDQELWDRANSIMRGKEKGSADDSKWAQQIVTPQYSEREYKRQGLEDKRKAAEQAQMERIRSVQEQADRGYAYANKLLENLDDGVLPETGGTGMVLSYVPGTDAYRFAQNLKTLKGMIAYGGLLGAKAGSPNGASGFGALSEKELSLLENLLGSLDQGLDREELKENLQQIASYFKKATTPRTISDKELSPSGKTDSIRQAPKKEGKRPIESFNMTANRS